MDNHSQAAKILNHAGFGAKLPNLLNTNIFGYTNGVLHGIINPI